MVQVRVLVVDDDEGIRETLRSLLEDTGYEVVEADGGEAALALLRSAQPPLVVLLDYVMAHLNGGELLRMAAAEGLDARHRFILMSASPRRINADPFVRQYALDRDIPIVAKPFDIDRLLALVAGAAASLADGSGSPGATPSTSPVEAPHPVLRPLERPAENAGF